MSINLLSLARRLLRGHPLHTPPFVGDFSAASNGLASKKLSFHLVSRPSIQLGGTSRPAGVAVSLSGTENRRGAESRHFRAVGEPRSTAGSPTRPLRSLEQGSFVCPDLSDKALHGTLRHYRPARRGQPVGRTAHLRTNWQSAFADQVGGKK